MLKACLFSSVLSYLSFNGTLGTTMSGKRLILEDIAHAITTQRHRYKTNIKYSVNKSQTKSKNIMFQTIKTVSTHIFKL